jgi:hypothetical protein
VRRVLPDFHLCTCTWSYQSSGSESNGDAARVRSETQKLVEATARRRSSRSSAVAVDAIVVLDTAVMVNSPGAVTLRTAAGLSHPTW